MLPGKAKGPLPPQQAFFLFGGCLRKERFFRHTAQERRDNTPPPPRTCAGDSMNTSEASCHRRDLSRAATRRELPGVQPPRTCAGLSMSTSDSELPKARLVPRGHAPRIARGATPAHVRWPLDEHERSELPKARIAWGATPAHVRWPLDEHKRSELPQARLVPRGHAPRIARGATPTK